MLVHCSKNGVSQKIKPLKARLGCHGGLQQTPQPLLYLCKYCLQHLQHHSMSNWSQMQMYLLRQMCSVHGQRSHTGLLLPGCCCACVYRCTWPACQCVLPQCQMHVSVANMRTSSACRAREGAPVLACRQNGQWLMPLVTAAMITSSISTAEHAMWCVCTHMACGAFRSLQEPADLMQGLLREPCPPAPLQ